jgi:hypothetical protein
MKAILRTSLEQSSVPLKAVADTLGVRYQYLADALNTQEPQRFPADLLVAFMRATGSIAPLRWLAAELQCAVVPFPAATAETEAVYAAFAAMVAEVGEDGALIQRVLADGTVTPDECDQAVQEVGRTITAAVAVEAALLEARDRALVRPAPAKMTLPATTAARRRA